MIRGSVLAMMALAMLGGCASHPRGGGGIPSETQVRSQDGNIPFIEIGAWLALDQSPHDCLMTSSALADDDFNWLWLVLHLGDNRSARVQGRGALTLVLQTEEGEVHLRDEGIRVSLEDGNTFLNSAGGPISIRSSGSAGSAAVVRMLVALPNSVPTSARVLRAEPVAERWSYRR